MNKRVKAIVFCALPVLAAIAIFAGMKSCANDLPESSGPLPLGAEVIFVAPASGNQVVVCKEGPQTTVYSVEERRYRLLESKSGYWIPDAQGKLVNIKIPQGARLRYVGLRSRYPASIETDPRMPKSERKFYDTVTNEWVSFPDPDYGDLTAVFERNGVMAGIKRRGSLAVWDGHKVVESKLGPELKEAMFVAISGSGLELMTADLDEMRVYSLDGNLLRSQKLLASSHPSWGFSEGRNDFYVMDGQDIQFSKGGRAKAINPEESSDVFFKTHWAVFPDGRHGIAVGAFSLRHFIRYEDLRQP